MTRYVTCKTAAAVQFTNAVRVIQTGALSRYTGYCQLEVEVKIQYLHMYGPKVSFFLFFSDSFKMKPWFQCESVIHLSKEKKKAGVTINK